MALLIDSSTEQCRTQRVKLMFHRKIQRVWKEIQQIVNNDDNPPDPLYFHIADFLPEQFCLLQLMWLQCPVLHFWDSQPAPGVNLHTDFNGHVWLLSCKHSARQTLLMWIGCASTPWTSCLDRSLFFLAPAPNNFCVWVFFFLAMSRWVSTVNGCHRDQHWEVGAAELLEGAMSVFNIAQIWSPPSSPSPHSHILTVSGVLGVSHLPESLCAPLVS